MIPARIHGLHRTVLAALLLGTGLTGAGIDVATAGEAGAPAAPSKAATAPALATAVAARQSLEPVYIAEGVVEAARRITLSAQVAGRLTRFDVRAGDRVARGQVIARIDERTASQQAGASRAQVAAANAALEAARKELERTDRLHRKQYVSQAAMERAQAQYDAAAAQARATIAQAGAASTVTALHTVAAPFAGTVSRTMVEQGDMAMPDKPLLELFDPADLRVSATVPEGVAAAFRRDRPVTVRLSSGDDGAVRELADLPALLMPVADPASHAFELRVPLPSAAAAGLAPGQFVRVALPLSPVAGAARAAGGAAAQVGGSATQASGSAAQASGRVTIPVAALVRRTEFAGVYVVGAEGRPQLRQVRPGRVHGDRVEVLAGLSEGERVALDPAAAARQR